MPKLIFQNNIYLKKYKSNTRFKQGLRNIQTIKYLFYLDKHCTILNFGVFFLWVYRVTKSFRSSFINPWKTSLIFLPVAAISYMTYQSPLRCVIVYERWKRPFVVVPRPLVFMRVLVLLRVWMIRVLGFVGGDLTWFYP
jgi:hypothetical protein